MALVPTVVSHNTNGGSVQWSLAIVPLIIKCLQACSAAEQVRFKHYTAVFHDVRNTI